MPKAGDVRSMFDRIVGRYDLLNRVLSLGQDVLWRHAQVRAVRESGGPVLDLCCGTGDVTLDYLRRTPQPSFVVAADFSLPMCRAAREKLSRKAPRSEAWSMACADGLCLPFADHTFRALTVAFGVRNFEDLERGLAELARVLIPGGVLAVLEFTPPRGAFLKAIYRPYLSLVVPLAGRILAGPGGAYGYLSSSIQSFFTPERMSGALELAGFRAVSARSLSLGITCLYSAVRA